jgi:hypothetical protein
MKVDTGQAVAVDSVEQEYALVAARTCSCGGHFRVLGQTLVVRDGRPYDLLDVVCQQCGQKGQFLFDIQSFFGACLR